MYRSLSLYPTSADPSRVDEHVRQLAAAFGRCPGFLSSTSSVDALLGPGARNGDVGRVLIVDFETLDDAMAAIASDDLRELVAEGESLTTQHFLFECEQL